MSFFHNFTTVVSMQHFACGEEEASHSSTLPPPPSRSRSMPTVRRTSSGNSIGKRTGRARGSVGSRNSLSSSRFSFRNNRKSVDNESDDSDYDDDGDFDYNPVTLFPPDKFEFHVRNKRNVADVITYSLTLPQKVFLFLEIPDSCILGQYMSYIMLITIVVSCTCFVLSSVEKFRHTPSTCDEPACENVEDLCPNTTICEPVEDSYFFIIDTCCVIMFTLDYVSRLITVAFVPPRLSGILPKKIKHRDAISRKQEPDPEYKWYQRLRMYVTLPFNIIDLLAILPFYVSFGAAVGRGRLVLLRVIRLIRVLRILKSKGIRTGLKIIQKALSASVSALSIMSFLTLLLVLLFGSIIYFFEGGDFTVNEEFKHGAYLRWNVNHTDKEKSPFTSRLMSIYWAVVTATTVGYGDFVPTSNLGRVAAVLLMYLGIIAIALPISIVGSNFDREYQAVHYREEEELSYTGTKQEKRNQMLLHMRQMSDTMKNITYRMDIITDHLMREAEREAMEMSTSINKTGSMASATETDDGVAPGSTMNKLLEVCSKE